MTSIKSNKPTSHRLFTNFASFFLSQQTHIWVDCAATMYLFVKCHLKVDFYYESHQNSKLSKKE